MNKPNEKCCERNKKCLKRNKKWKIGKVFKTKMKKERDKKGFEGK